MIDGTFERMFIIIARLHTNNYKHRNIHNNENFIGASGLLTLLFPIIAASSLSARLGSLAIRPPINDFDWVYEKVFCLLSLFFLLISNPTKEVQELLY